MVVKKCTDRIGETQIADNGMQMTIIRYQNSMDIDLKFENGELVYGTTYYVFKSGHIRLPSKIKMIKNKSGRIGETNIANNGLRMTIITYRSFHDIDVQFENNKIKKHISYGTFKNGDVKCTAQTLATKDKPIESTIIDYRTYKRKLLIASFD